MPHPMAAMRVGAAGGLVRASASAADVALANWWSRRRALPPNSSGGQSWGPDPLHAHTQTVSLTKLLAIQLLANAAHRNDVKSR